MKLEELRDNILLHLGVLAAGQPPSAQDAKDVIAAINRQHEGLVRKGLADWPVDDVPEWAADEVRDIVAASLTSTFDIPPQKAVVIKQEAELARMELADKTAIDDEDPVRTEYF